MAGLQVRENQTTGALTLEPSARSRLGNLAFGLIWLGILSVFLLPNLLGERIDWLNVVLVLLFVMVPFGSAFISTLVSSSIVLDRGNRSLTRARRFLFIPISTTTFSFSDLKQIELQGFRPSSRQQASPMWMVNAVLRDNRRIRLNWQGTQEEMIQFAQKISTLTGAPWEQAEIKLPTVVKTMLDKIAPEQMKEFEEANSTASPSTSDSVTVDSVAPPASAPISPMLANELASSPAPTESNSTTDQPATINLNSLSMDALEKRVASDAMDSDARYALARKYHANGKPDRAITLYQETLRSDPTNTHAQNDLGVALQARGKRVEAEAAYRRAIALDPFLFTTHLNLALLLRGMNRAMDASQEFFQARQNARGDDETRLAEAASSGMKMEPQISKI